MTKHNIFHLRNFLSDLPAEKPAGIFIYLLIILSSRSNCGNRKNACQDKRFGRISSRQNLGNST
jgi:hypothetical protein